MRFAESGVAGGQATLPGLSGLVGERLGQFLFHHAEHDLTEEFEFVGLDVSERRRVEVGAVFGRFSQIVDVGVQTGQAGVGLVEEVQVGGQIGQADVGEYREFLLGLGIQFEVADERFGSDVAVLPGHFPHGFDQFAIVDVH